MDELLEALGLSYDQLNDAERSTYQKYYEDVSTREMTITDVKEFIKNLRMAVDEKLAIHNLSKEEDLFLKARLQNYIVLEAFLSGPEIARKRLEEWIKSLKK